MRFALCILALLAVAAAATSLKPLTESESLFVFQKWMQQHGKHYSTSAEFDTRLNAFRFNLEKVRQHQAKPNQTYTMGMTRFADLMPEEFSEMMLGYVPRDRSFLRNKNVVKFAHKHAPASLNWCDQGACTPVKDQGQCGSCWSFSTTGGIEGAYAIENSASPISLSEQELVDCSQSAGNEGCEGGLMDDAFQWVISNGGLCTEEAYPYTAQDGTCEESTCTSAVTISAFTDVTPNSESQLQAAVVNQPISIAVDASEGWQLYTGGILDSSCGCSTNLDHGVLLVGYGTDSGEAYWTVKNSWGASWGEAGFIRLKRNVGGSGTCGLCMDPSFPTGATKVGGRTRRHH